MKCLAIAVLLALTAPIDALGQDGPTLEIGAGYSVVFSRSDYDQWAASPGWRVETARFVSPHWGIAGTVQGNYHSIGDSYRDSHRTYTFLAGVKTAPNRQHRVMPFFEALAGVAHVSDTLRPIGVPPVDVTANAFVVQPGNRGYGPP